MSVLYIILMNYIYYIIYIIYINILLSNLQNEFINKVIYNAGTQNCFLLGEVGTKESLILLC